MESAANIRAEQITTQSSGEASGGNICAAAKMPPRNRKSKKRTVLDSEKKISVRFLFSKKQNSNRDSRHNPEDRTPSKIPRVSQRLHKESRSSKPRNLSLGINRADGEGWDRYPISKESYRSAEQTTNIMPARIRIISEEVKEIHWEEKAIRNLLAALLDRAIRDAMLSYGKKHNKNNRLLVRQATAWLKDITTETKKDCFTFLEICRALTFNPIETQKNIFEIINVARENKISYEEVIKSYPLLGKSKTA